LAKKDEIIHNKSVEINELNVKLREFSKKVLLAENKSESQNITKFN